MKTTKFFLLAGIALVLPFVAGAQPSDPPANPPIAAATATANNTASADALNKILLDLQHAMALMATNTADPDAVKKLKLGLQQVLAQAVTDPPDPPQAQQGTSTNSGAPTAGQDAATPGSAPAAAASDAAPATPVDYGTNGLRMNFVHAPLDLVLDYMSSAAGFIVSKDTEVRGTVDVISKGPVTKDEAVELLYSSLKKNGYNLVRNGRILTITSPDDAKYHTPIEAYKYPNTVENSDEMVTEIIPVRYADVTQLMNNLQILLPTTATLSANVSANSLILVATKTDVHRMLEIITALDTSIASVSSIRVFLLRYEDAKDLATLVTQLFSPQSSTQGGGGGNGFRQNLFNMFRGGGGPGGPGGFGGGPGGGGSPGGGSGAAGGAAAAHVTAVGDDRSNALIVSAPADLLNTIAEMVDKIDQPVADITELKVFTLKYADPSDVAAQITAVYPDDTTSGNANQGPFPFFRFGGGGGGGQRGGGQNTPDDRTRKLGRVLAVAEPRTKKIIVTAPKTLMPQISEMIADLDIPGQQEVVSYYELQNADPVDVQQALTDLFNRSNVRMSSSANSAGSLLGTSNPLRQRATQQQPNLNTTTTLGTSGGGRGGATP